MTDAFRFEDLAELYPEVWLKIKARLNISGTPKLLGRGCYGFAYDLFDGRVLKLTEDITDAYGAILFKEKPSPYVVDIYDAFQYSIPNDWCAEINYGIVTKKLLPLTSDQYAFVRMCDIDFPYGLPHKKLKGLQGSLTKVQARKLKYKIEWLQGLTNEFAKYDFNWNDFHIGNFLRNGRHQIQVIDLGHTVAHQTPEIPEL